MERGTTQRTLCHLGWYHKMMFAECSGKNPAVPNFDFGDEEGCDSRESRKLFAWRLEWELFSCLQGTQMLFFFNFPAAVLYQECIQNVASVALRISAYNINLTLIKLTSLDFLYGINKKKQDLTSSQYWLFTDLSIDSRLYSDCSRWSLAFKKEQPKYQID